MKPLSTYLALAGPVHPYTATILGKAERIAPEVVMAGGVLLNGGDGVDLYDLLAGNILTPEERDEYERANAALDATRLTYNGENKSASDVACNIYTPQIDAAYYLGLVIGFHVAQTIGGAK